MHWRVCDLVDRLAGEPKTGLIFVDNHGHRRDYTFAEIAAFSARYAAVLRAFGVHEGERVYVRLSTTGKAIFTLLALERLGAIAEYSEAAAAGASTVIGNRKSRPAIDAAREKFAADARYVLIGEECEGWARLDTLAHVASASPPAVSLDEAQLASSRERAQAQLGAVASDVVWCALNFEDNCWLHRAIAQAWLAGCTAIAHDGMFDARERLDLVRELDVTILLQRAEEFHAQLALPDPKRFKLPRLRGCIVLDDATDELLHAQWHDRFGIPLKAGTIST
jgi:acyl-coenzyme A synthetase/AMP-(fatty) acid ligase